MYKFLNIIRNKIFAFIYPLINNFVSEENKFLRSYITDSTSGDVLEIGAGNGGNINYYKNYNNLILLDNNIDLLKKSTSIDRCSLLLATSDYLPFKKSSLDSIVTSLVICSVDDVGKTFNELNSIRYLIDFNLNIQQPPDPNAIINTKSPKTTIKASPPSSPESCVVVLSRVDLPDPLPL